MKPMKSLLLVGLLAAIGSAPAMASVSASASISDVTITLVDLNPLDGIAPSINRADLGNISYISASVNRGLAYDSQSNADSQVLGVATSSTAMAARAIAVASVAASAVNTPSANLSASGSAMSGPAGSYSSFESYAYSPYYKDYFTLSANTAAIFSLSASTSATASTTASSPESEGAYSYAYFILSASNAYGGFQISSQEMFSGAGYNWGVMSNSKSATWGGAIVNASAGELTGYYYAYAEASGSTNVAAVPEPETYAMFLAGLGIVGAFARRRC